MGQFGIGVRRQDRRPAGRQHVGIVAAVARGDAVAQVKTAACGLEPQGGGLACRLRQHVDELSVRGDDARRQPGARQIAFDSRGLRGGTQQRQFPPPLLIACLPDGGAGLQHSLHRIAVPVRVQQRGIVGAGVQPVARAPPPDL